MRLFQIAPLVGVGPVEFGATRDTVRQALGGSFRTFRKSPSSEHEIDEFSSLGFHMYYRGLSPTVAFIELFHAEGSVFRYNGVDVFRTPAPELFQFLADQAKWYERVGSFIFPAIQVALYRSHSYDPDCDEFDRWEAFAVAPAGYYGETPRRRAVPSVPSPEKPNGS